MNFIVKRGNTWTSRYITLVHQSPEFLMGGIPTWSDEYRFDEVIEHRWDGEMHGATNCPTWNDVTECRCMLAPEEQ